MCSGIKSIKKPFVYTIILLVLIVILLTSLTAYQYKKLNQHNIILFEKFTETYTTTILYLLDMEKTITNVLEKKEITLLDISMLKYMSLQARNNLDQLVSDYKFTTDSNYLDAYDQSLERYLLKLWSDYSDLEKQFIITNKSTIDLDKDTSAMLQIHLEKTFSITKIIKSYYPSIDSFPFSTDEILVPEEFFDDDKWKKVLLDLNDLTKW